MQMNSTVPWRGMLSTGDTYGVWKSWMVLSDMLQFPGILLPIAVTLVALPGQEDICQIVGLVCPSGSFPFFVTFVSIAGQDVSSMGIWETQRLSTGWYRFCSPKALLRIILSVVHQECSKLNIATLMMLSLCFDLGVCGYFLWDMKHCLLRLLFPSQLWRNPAFKQDLSLQSCLWSKLPASCSVCSSMAWNIVRGRTCGGLLVIWLYYFSTTWALNI